MTINPNKLRQYLLAEIVDLVIRIDNERDKLGRPYDEEQTYDDLASIRAYKNILTQIESGTFN